jgi:hypothetical protein
MAQASSSPAPTSICNTIAALVSAGVGGLSLVVAGGMWPDNLEWAPAFAALAGLYLLAAFGLWRGRGWGRFVGLGVGLWGLACFGETAVVIGVPPWVIAGLALHSLMLVFAGACRAEVVERRHGFALTMVGAALPCALIYGLAPQHDWLTSAGVLGGAAVVVAATAGLGRGRTWGLLAALAGAVLIATTTAAARPLGWLLHPHPILPNENPLALLGLGIAASILAFAATVPYLGPIVRFLARSERG